MKTVTICINHRSNPAVPSCAAKGSLKIAEEMSNAIALNSIPVNLERFKCLGACEKGPNVKLSPGGAFFHEVTPESLPGIIQAITQFATE